MNPTLRAEALPGAGPLFNPQARAQVLPLGDGQRCVVIDDALANPAAVAAWAAGLAFEAPTGYPYPGLVAPLPPDVTARMAEVFAERARSALGARRTLDASARASIVTVPPGQLEPRQWQCHRDRIVEEPSDILFIASVLYLFQDPQLGGTSFYRPRQSAQETEQLVADSQRLDARAFGERYGLQASYMHGSNAYFEQVACVPAAWNRLIFYDGAIFHSADVGRPHALDPDPQRGRLTLNGFFTCRRQAR